MKKQFQNFLKTRKTQEIKTVAITPSYWIKYCGMCMTVMNREAQFMIDNNLAKLKENMELELTEEGLEKINY